MDDETEKKYRVRYRDAGFPGPAYTRPLTMEQAMARKIMMDSTEGVTGAEVLDEDAIAQEKAHAFRVEGEGRQMLDEARRYVTAAKAQVDQDVDASLEEPTVFSKHSGDEPDEDTALESCEARHTRFIALEHAMKLATMPLGGMVVQTSRMSADDVVTTARTFLAFLNEEDASA